MPEIAPACDLASAEAGIEADNPTFPSIQARAADTESMEGTEIQPELRENEANSSSRKRSWFWYFRASRNEDDYHDFSNVPRLSYLELFNTFLFFGVRSFGNPTANITMMKDELVVNQKWVSIERFNRVYAVYQILPGPDGIEVACYFGYISRGRIGAIIGGIGYLLPGSLLMLLVSYLYVEYGLDNQQTQAAFRCIRNTIAALILRSTYKFADTALKEIHKTTEEKIFHWHRAYLCLFGYLTAVMRMNFFITLALCSIMNFFFHSKLSYSDYIAYFIGAVAIAVFILYSALVAVPSTSLIGDDFSRSSDGPDDTELFVLGLIAGLVTFGGAYATIPFMFTVAVTNGKWLTASQFLDALALAIVAPSPLINFVMLIGWIRNGITGAVLMMIGIFLPAFSFTLLGHNFFEKLVDNPYLQPFLDGVSFGVIGLLVRLALQFLNFMIDEPIDAVVFALTFWALFHFTHRYTVPMIIIVAAIAGQVLYKD
jgi:chromate transporter